MPHRSSRADAIERWLSVARSWQPSPSHDGREVLFVSDRTGLPLAWRCPVRPGPSRPLVRSPDRVGRVDASPTGPRAVLSRDAGGNEVWQLELVDLSGGGVLPLTSDPKVMNLAHGWMDDGRRFLYASNARDFRYFDVYARDVDSSGAPVSVFSGDAWHMAYGTRGDRVLVGRLNTFLNIDLFLVEGRRVVHLNPHDGEVSVSSATLGADAVYVATNPGREFLGLYRYPFDGGSPTRVREYPGDVECVRASPSGDRLLLSVNRGGWSELREFDPATGRDRKVPLDPPGVITELQWRADGTSVVYDLGWANGHEIFLRRLAERRSVRLTRSPIPPPFPLPAPRAGTVTAEDGLAVPYWEYVRDSHRARGTIFWVHGGPEGQARPEFDADLGAAVGEGWRVIVPNVRGSTGYGRTYVHLDDVRRRMDSVRDLRDLARALARSRKAEPGEIGILGGSYGGFMVLAAITTYPELWGAAVEYFGISNFVTFLERTAEWRRSQREAEYGNLAHDREFLTEISPIHHLDRVRAPLLVAHGKNDVRVPFGEAEQIVRELADRGARVELVAFENEGHGFSRRENQLTALRRSLAFLAEHVGAPPRPPRVRAGRGASARATPRSGRRRTPATSARSRSTGGRP